MAVLILVSNSTPEKQRPKPLFLFGIQFEESRLRDYLCIFGTMKMLVNRVK